MTGREDWTYTFCDAVTNVELATLPLTKVGYTRDLSGVGKLGAYLHLADEKIRNLDPWSATIPRRTKVYAEHRGADGQDRTVWGGMLVGAEESDDSDGTVLSCITFEGWLHRQRLLSNLTVAGSTRTFLEQLVARAQVLTDVGIEVDPSGPAGQVRPAATYLAREIKPVLELIENLGTSTPISLEFRVDCFRDTATGLFRQVLRFGEPRIGRTYEESRLTFSYPEGGLTKWKRVRDGSGADNVMPMLGSGSGETQPFEILYDDEAGLDEIASGFPTWMRDFQAQDTDVPALIRARGTASMRAGIAGEYVYSGVQLRPESYLGRVDPGDDMALEIAHRSLREFPEPVTTITRVLGESVTVGDAGNGDQVSVTIGGAA